VQSFLLNMQRQYGLRKARIVSVEQNTWPQTQFSSTCYRILSDVELHETETKKRFVDKNRTSKAVTIMWKNGFAEWPAYNFSIQHQTNLIWSVV